MIGREIAELDSHLRQRRAHHRPDRRARPARDRHRPPRRPRSTATSTSTRERSSASPGCWDPAAPSSSGCSTAPTAPTTGSVEINGAPGQGLLPAQRGGTPDRVLVRGPPRRGHHRRPHRGREHRPGHAGSAWLAAPDPARRAGRAWWRSSWPPWASARPTRPCSPATCPAATSRRSCWPVGWRPPRSCSSSTSRPAASTSAPRPTSSARSPSSPAEGLAVIFISSELEEVLRLAQRIVVMRDRRQIGLLDSHDDRPRGTRRLHGERQPRERGVTRLMKHRLFWPASCLLALHRPQHRGAAAVHQDHPAGRRALRSAHRHPPPERAADAGRPRDDPGHRHARHRPVGRRGHGDLRCRHPDDHRRLGQPGQRRHGPAGDGRGRRRSPFVLGMWNGFLVAVAEDPADHRDLGADAGRPRGGPADHRRLHHHGRTARR